MTLKLFQVGNFHFGSSIDFLFILTCAEERREGREERRKRGERAMYW